MFLGRKEELNELNYRYNSNKFEFGIVLSFTQKINLF